MKRLWEEHCITLLKEQEKIEIIIADDNTIPSNCCLRQRQNGVFVQIEITTLFNEIKDYVKEGYEVFDWDDIIPKYITRTNKSKEKNLYNNNQLNCSCL